MIHNEPPRETIAKIFQLMIVAVFVTGFLMGSGVLEPGYEAAPHARIVDGICCGIVCLVMFAWVADLAGRRR